MNGASYIFFGLLLIPLIIFLIWLIRKDRNRNYIGLFMLIAMIIIALIAIIRYDTKFMKTGPGASLQMERSEPK